MFKPDFIRTASTPRWSWCDKCSSNVFVTFDVLYIDKRGVSVVNTLSACYKEWSDKKAEASG